jgi:hypothetical protein
MCRVYRLLSRFRTGAPAGARLAAVSFAEKREKRLFAVTHLQDSTFVLQLGITKVLLPQ